MDAADIRRAFELLDIDTEEKRDRVLSQGKVFLCDEGPEANYKQWVSTGSEETDVNECQIGRRS